MDDPYNDVIQHLEKWIKAASKTKMEYLIEHDYA